MTVTAAEFKALRVQAGLSYNAAAKLLQVNPRTIRYWENPSVDRMANDDQVRVVKWFVKGRIDNVQPVRVIKC